MSDDTREDLRSIRGDLEQALACVPDNMLAHLNVSGAAVPAAAMLRTLNDDMMRTRPGGPIQYLALSSEPLSASREQAIALATHAHASAALKARCDEAVIGIGACAVTDPDQEYYNVPGLIVHVCARYGAGGQMLCAARLTHAADYLSVQERCDLTALFIFNELLHAAGCERITPGIVQAHAMSAAQEMLRPHGLPLYPELQAQDTDTDPIRAGLNEHADGWAVRMYGGQGPAFREMPAGCDPYLPDRHYMIPISAPLSECDYLIKHLLDRMTGRTGVYSLSIDRIKPRDLAPIVRSCYGRGDLIVHAGDALLQAAHRDLPAVPFYDTALTHEAYVQAVAMRGMQMHTVIAAAGFRLYVLIPPGTPLTDLLLQVQRGTVLPVYMPHLAKETAP